MKPLPSKAARTLRRSLSSLAQRGVGGEADNARQKLARLESRFDFTAPEPDDPEDIFANVEITFIPGDYRELFHYEPAEVTAAAFVKWALETRFKVSGLFRQNGTAPALWIECSDASLPTMRHLAGIIRSAFAELWREYLKTPGVEAGCRRAFELGIYDGMMDDPREHAQLLPPATVRVDKTKRKTKRKAKAKSPAIPPGVAIHPYTLAVELGRKVRLSTPIGEVIAELTDKLSESK